MPASSWLFVGRFQHLGPASPAIGRPLQNPEPEQSESSSEYLVDALRHALGRLFPIPHHDQRRDDRTQHKNGPARGRRDVSCEASSTHCKNPDRGNNGFHVFESHRRKCAPCDPMSLFRSAHASRRTFRTRFGRCGTTRFRAMGWHGALTRIVELALEGSLAGPTACATPRDQSRRTTLRRELLIFRAPL